MISKKTQQERVLTPEELTRRMEELAKQRGIVLSSSHEPTNVCLLTKQSALVSAITNLTRQYSFSNFSTLEEALQHETTPQTLFLLDVEDSFFDAYFQYTSLRLKPGYEKAPLLFLIDVTQTQQALEKCNLRNNDYVVKPIDSLTFQNKSKKLLKPPPKKNRHLHQPGDLLAARYEVIRFLNEGGMGQVFLVRDLMDLREYALKLLPHETGDRPEMKKRFQQEIEALLNLNHPNIVRIYGYDYLESYSFYTMEHLSHGSLADQITKHGPFAYDRALPLLIQMAQALHYAHENGILHRDLKPENILFTPEGLPVLTDFGLAMSLARKASRVTQQGYVIGTIHYMAPEQLSDPLYLDPKSDVYSLGAILFKMLTGTTPFQGRSLIDSMRLVLYEPTPDPRKYIQQLPESIAQLCQQSMHKDPQQRMASALEFAKRASHLLP